MSGTRSERLDRDVYVALAAMAAAVFVIANDLTALSVALPDMERDFDADVSTVQWVINAYALVFGVLIVTGGRLADLLGRRRVFFAGTAVFAVFSLLGAVAQSAAWLIGARALMGIGGAMIWPAVLGMTYSILPEGRRALAGALILGSAGFGNAAGPLIGGALTAIDWRLILLLNLPIAGFAALITWRAVPESTGADAERRIDYAGVATLSLGLVALLLALDQVTEWGWGDPRILALFGACVLLLVGFAVVERRAGGAALVPPDVIGNPSFRAACLAVLLMSPTFFAALMYLPQFMQKILDYSPFQAGAGMLPMMGAFAAVSFISGTLYERLGAKVVLSAGALCLTLGPLLVSTVGSDSGWAALVPGMVVLGLGVGLFYSSVTTAAVTAVDPARASLAGGLVYMFQIAGGSVGLGLTTTIFTTAMQDELQSDPLTGRLTEAGREAAQGTLAGTDSAAEAIARFPAAVVGRIEEVVRDAFAAGMQWSFRLVAAIALLGLVVTVLFVGGRLIGSRRAGAAGGTGG